MKEDRVILDPVKHAEEIKKRNEEESKRNADKLEEINRLEQQKANANIQEASTAKD